MRPLLLCFLFTLILIRNASAQNFGWAKSFSSTSGFLSQAKSVVKDSIGNIYVAGEYSATMDFDPGPGQYFLTPAGSYDVFVCKLNPAGNFIWAISLGGTLADFYKGIAADKYGNTYITGNFKGTADFDPGPAVFNLVASGPANDNPFITKINSSGQFVWAKRIESQASQNQRSIAVDDLQNVYFSSDYKLAVDADPGPGTSIFSAATLKLFLLKLDINGNYINAVTVGDGSIALTSSMKIRNNHLFISAANTTAPGVCKYDLNLNLIWFKIASALTGYVTTNELVVDGAENVILTGHFDGSADMDPGPAIYSVTSAGGTDIFVLKWDNLGAFVWVKTMGGTGNEFPLGSSADNNGDIFITGTFNSPSFRFDPAVPASAVTSSSTDIFINKMNSAGTYQWVKQIGSSNDTETAFDIEADNFGNCYIVGSYKYSQVDFNPDPAVIFNLTNANGSSAPFVLKLSAGNQITGNVFIDANNDGIKQTTELAVPGVMLKAAGSSSNAYGNSGSDAKYNISASTGNYTITMPIVPAYYTTSVSAHSAAFGTAYGTIDSLNNFPLTAPSSVNDLAVTVTPLNIARRGTDLYMRINYQNTGTTTLSGNVSFTHAPQIIYQQSFPVQTTYSNPQLTWNYSNLQPFESRQITVRFSVPVAAVTGDTLHQNAAVYPIVNDTTPVNNSYRSDVIIVGSFDPNDKTVFPQGPVSTSSVNADTLVFQYSIRFQNTGNDTAFVVKITDSIRSTLNLSSLKVVASSHPYTLDILSGNAVRFLFENILLPDSLTNEPLSHGFITYTIRPLSPLSSGTIIKNKASIFFDYNEAVVTNETSTLVTNVVPVILTDFTVVTDCDKAEIRWNTSMELNHRMFIIERSSDGVQWSEIAYFPAVGNNNGRGYLYRDNRIIKGNIFYRLKQIDIDGRKSFSSVKHINCGKSVLVKIQPNPAKDFIYINADSFFTYQLIDLKGAQIRSSASLSRSGVINVSSLNKGMYILKIVTDSGSSQHKILIN